MHSLGVRNGFTKGALLGVVGVVSALVAVTACSSPTTNQLPTVGTEPGDIPPTPDSGTGGSPAAADSGVAPAADTGAASSDGAADAPPPMMMTTDMQWNDGQQITGATEIAAGVTITIAPGATVTFATGAFLTIAGTLSAASSSDAGSGSGDAGPHAALVGPTGGTWGGLIVASGGTLSLDGVDIENATTAIETKAGDLAATYDNGTINAANVPFQLDTGSSLSTSHATVTGTIGASAVNGAFTASYLNYTKSASGEGIITGDPTAILSISDSILTGSGPAGDFVVSDSAAQLTVAYTKITNVHCAFHFNGISAFDISYVTAETNAYGAMLYGSSGAGPFSISHSNFEGNTTYALDEEGTNGTITLDSSYIAGMSNVPGATNVATAPVANAGPR